MVGSVSSNVHVLKVNEFHSLNKLYSSLSGGWAAILCPCGIVYSVKFLLHAKSPRDFTDMLFSKHLYL